MTKLIILLFGVCLGWWLVNDFNETAIARQLSDRTGEVIMEFRTGDYVFEDGKLKPEGKALLEKTLAELEAAPINMPGNKLLLNNIINVRLLAGDYIKVRDDFSNLEKAIGFSKEIMLNGRHIPD